MGLLPRKDLRKYTESSFINGSLGELLVVFFRKEE